MATDCDNRQVDKIVNVFNGDTAIKAAMSGDRRPIQEKCAKGTRWVKFLKFDLVKFRRLGTFVQTLSNGLGKNELKAVKYCKTVRCVWVVQHVAYGTGREANEHGIVNETSRVYRAAVDDAAAEKADPFFGFSAPSAQLVQVFRWPMLKLQPDLSLIIKRKPVLKLFAATRSQAILRPPRTQFGEQVEQTPPGSVSFLSGTIRLISAPESKEPLEGVLGRHGRVKSRGHVARIFGDQVIWQFVCVTQFDFGENFKTDQTGRAREIADRHRGYEDESTLRRDAIRITPKLKSRVITSKRSIESFEFLAESFSLPTPPGPLGARESSR